MSDLIYPTNQPPAGPGQDPALAAYPAQASNAYGQPQASAPAKDPAVELIRQKINALYAEEPTVAQEQAEIAAAPVAGSDHQRFMAELTQSGKSTAEIQMAWHNYYTALPDHEKYRVWQDFYVANGANPAYQQFTTPSQPVQTVQPMQPIQQPAAVPAAPVAAPLDLPRVQVNPRSSSLERHTKLASAAATKTAQRLKESIGSDSPTDIKKRILDSVKTVSSPSAKGKLTAKHHLQSLMFGLGTGLVVVCIFLFSFFNEFVIAPLIQPSRRINDTPVIVDVASTVVSGGPKVIIPKINVEIPVDYSQTTTDEKQIELALDKGIVHYPTTVRPGQVGNAAFFGHSSNNIFNPGKYKFAFVFLHELTDGDTFYLTNDGKTYAYRVFSKRIVQPTEVSVLGPVAGKTATATLITCDPPGTSLNRLVVVGEQISPDAGGNGQPAVQQAATSTSGATATVSSDLPGNGPTLWSRIWGSIF